MKFDNYQQEVEMEILAAIFAIIAVFTVTFGAVWAVAFVIRWLVGL